MEWHWNRFSEEEPRIGDDVLVCFEPGNPYSCAVVSLELDDENNYIWCSLDRDYPVDDTDYWTEILIPDFWDAQIKEDE